MDAFMQYGVVAGMQAMRDSGIDGHRGQLGAHRRTHGFGHGRTRVDRGNLRQVSGDSFAEEGVAVLHSRQHHQPGERPSIDRLQSSPGPNLAVATACTTSTHAIGLVAMRLIQYGDVDAMLAGGSEMATCVTGMSGFAQAKALSQRNDDPQGGEPSMGQGPRRIRDGRRRGRDDARGIRVRPRRAARRSMPRCVGFGMSGDAFHVTAPPENGEGARKSMVNALGRCEDQSRSSAVRQRTRDLDRAGRSRRDHGDPPRIRRRPPRNWR